MTLFPIDRPMQQAMRATKMRGVHLAIVVENTEGADNPGARVRVKYPHMNEEEKSFWARLAIPMAGSASSLNVAVAHGIALHALMSTVTPHG